MLAERNYSPIPWSELKLLAKAARLAVRRGEDPYDALYYTVNPTPAMLKALRAKR